MVKIDVCLSQFNAKSILLKKFGNSRAVFDGIIKMLIRYWNCFLVWVKSIVAEMLKEKKKKLKDVFHKPDSINHNAFRVIF